MHRRNIYSCPIQYEDLARSYPPLLEHLVPANPPVRGKTIDFQNEQAQRCLTQALLYRDFHLQLSLPNDRLCPPVPNRLNYVLWIQDIIRAHRYLFKEDVRTIRGIDIGTGASAIYPLLACKMEPTWRFVATEIDSVSFTYAERNIQLNQLENHINLRRASTGGPILFPLEDYTGPPFDFVMCNPPFYSSRAEISRSADMKEFPPNSVCTGADTEMIYAPGGEAAFIGQMVEESERHGNKCRWYTSMIGKLTTISEIIVMLRKRSVRTYAITEFVQGQTRRLGVAWSFTSEHLPDSIARLNIHPNHSLHSLQPNRNTLINHFQISFATIEAQHLQTSLLDVCRSARISATERPLILDEEERPLVLQRTSNPPRLTTFRLQPILIQAKSNTWSRKERRNQQQQQSMGGQHHDGSTALQILHQHQHQHQHQQELICSMQWAFDFSVLPASVLLESQWVYGDDRSMFEGLVSHIVRKMGQALEPYSMRSWDHYPPPTTRDSTPAGTRRGSPSNMG